jgi:TolB-like protein
MIETHRETQPGKPDNEQVLEALSRVLASKTFAEVFRLKKFLEYSVKETLAGRGERLKGFVIALEVFDKDDPSDAQTTTVVRVEAGRLRRRLKDYYEAEGANDPVRISIPKGGYSSSFEAVNFDSQPKPYARKPASGKHPLRYPSTWVLVIVSLLLFVLFGERWDRSEKIPDVLSGTSPTVAVLPFENETGNRQYLSFVSELTEDIVMDLSSLSALNIISMSSVQAYAGQDLSPQEIGSRLSASYVLRGQLEAHSPTLLVRAELYDIVNGRQLWAERFEHPAGDEPGLQMDLVQQVISSLSINPRVDNSNIIGRRFTENKEAWFLYKQAMNLVNPPTDPARLELAQKAFEQVIGMDPGFAGGFAGSAYTRAFKVFFGHSETLYADRQAAIELAAKARAIDPSFGLTFSALAFIHMSEREFDKALQLSARAIEIQPNDPYIVAYHGFIVAASGDLKAGIDFVKRAVRLDPLNARTPYLNMLGLLNFLDGRYTDAQDALLRNQARGGPHGSGQLRSLAASYSRMGKLAKAEYALKLANSLAPDEDRWRQWLLNSFRDPAALQPLFDEIETIHKRANTPDSFRR